MGKKKGFIETEAVIRFGEHSTEIIAESISMKNAMDMVNVSMNALIIMGRQVGADDRMITKTILDIMHKSFQEAENVSKEGKVGKI